VSNLGPIASAEERVDVQVRDLDQTVIGNPAHDLVRLGLSLAMASRGSDLPGVTTSLMLEQMMIGYEAAMKRTRTEVPIPASARALIKEANTRSWKTLLADNLKDSEPTIPLGARFWPLTKDERRAVEELFSTKQVANLVTLLRRREDDAKVRVVDAAFWVKGCSSLGKLRMAVLVRVGREGKRSVKRGKYCLIDIKEAVVASAPAYKKARMPESNAARVVEGARALSPFLGERMRAAELLGRSVFLRELMPQDLKFELESLSQREALRTARYLANVVGRAHARQMDAKTRAAWSRELARHRPKTLDAPSWLWSSIVALAGTHEAAYLEHCRKYALQRASS
jgi:uncharacterized protein (DUF2252 family)